MLGTLLLLWLSPARADADLGRWAEAFSKGSRREARLVRDGDLSSGYGLVVDRTCLKGETKKGRAELKTALDAIVRDSLSTLRACDRDIPNVTFHRAAVGVMLRARLGCTDSKTDPHFNREHPAAAYTLWKFHHEDIQPELQDAWEAEERPFLIVVRDSLRVFVKRDDAPMILYHESLHQTWANNQWKHGDIERIDVDKDKPCALNMLDDRIRVFEGACGYHMQRASDLRLRIQTCGLQKGCVEPLKRVTGTPDPPDDEWSRWLRGNYGPYWREKPREAELTCERIQKRLDGLARERKFPDPMAKLRAEGLRDWLSWDRGGLRPGVPAAYLSALSVEDRRELAAIPDLDERIDRHCGPFALTSVYAGHDERILYEFDPDKAPKECPLSSAAPEYRLTAKFAQFHRLDRELQQGSLAVAKALESFVDGRDVDIDQAARDAIGLYQTHCPLHVGEYAPALCDMGESRILETVREIRARIGLDAP